MDRVDPSLAKKLGIKPGVHGIVIDDAIGLSELLSPDWQDSDLLSVDVIVIFARSMKELEAVLDSAVRIMSAAGGLWISWPKKASKIPSDIDGDVLRSRLLPTGLVDNKICSVDEVWTAIRFVWRVELRKTLLG